MVEHEPGFEPRRKERWEPLQLTPIGNLGTVLRTTGGSVNGDGGAKKP
jgi:hypothetical protein